MATQSPKGYLLVLSNCTDPARDKEFNDWYTNIHIPDVLETPGIIRGIRLGMPTDPREGQGKYLALYELDTDDIESVQKGLSENLAKKREQGRMIDCLQLVTSGYYTLISDMVKGGSAK